MQGRRGVGDTSMNPLPFRSNILFVEPCRLPKRLTGRNRALLLSFVARRLVMKLPGAGFGCAASFGGAEHPAK